MIRRLSLFLFVAFLPFCLLAAIPKDKHPLEIPLPEAGHFSHAGDRLINNKGTSRAWIEHSGFYLPGTPIEVAEAYLKTRSLEVNYDNLVFHSQKETPGGIHVRFEQVIHGIPVYKSRVVITLDKKHQVRFVSNGTRDIPDDFFPEFVVDESRALDAATTYLNSPFTSIPPKVEPFILKMDKIYSCYRVSLSGLEGYIENWEIFVDGITGEILAARDCNLYSTGRVFDPDPIAKNRTMYGETGYVDNGNEDNDSLNTSLVTRELGELDYEDGLYYLKNDYACIVDQSEPFSGLYGRPSDDFSCTRSDSLFEPVNIFYFINQSMRYVNDTLGYDVWPLEYEGPPRFDPDGLQGQANCCYNPGYGIMSFGNPDNAVDSGEDQALILHELMHGIHDWISGNGISNNEGLSEGCCDYWAQSYLRNTNLFLPTDEQYDWFCLWGLKPLYGEHYMRVTDYYGHYPEDLYGEEHEDGQMWSSSLMTLYDSFGRDCVDRLLLETLSMLDEHANQQTAALAFLGADNILYDGEHVVEIFEVFYNRGYLEETIFTEFSSDVQCGGPPLIVQFIDFSASLNGPILSWEWDLDGDGEIDSNDPDPQFTYQELGNYDVELTVNDGVQSATIRKENFITVNSGILIYDANPEGVDYSGEFIRQYVSNVSAGLEYYTNDFPTSLTGFSTVFLCFGSVDLNYENCVISSEEQVDAMVDYLENGGSIYIEGGQLFYTFRINQDNDVYFRALNAFGIDHSVMEFGEREFLPLTGGDGSSFEGFYFEETNQQYHRNMEVYPYLTTSVPLFFDSDSVIVAVQNENANGGKSICMSYSLSELVDEGGNNRIALMDQIADFLAMPTLKVDDEAEIPITAIPVKVYPNPFNNRTQISYELPYKGKVNLSIYNLLGQRVYTFHHRALDAGSYCVSWQGINDSGKEVASGVYLLRLGIEDPNQKEQVIQRKISLVK